MGDAALWKVISFAYPVFSIESIDFVLKEWLTVNNNKDSILSGFSYDVI